jgi:hypothetical protein
LASHQSGQLQDFLEVSGFVDQRIHSYQPSQQKIQDHSLPLAHHLGHISLVIELQPWEFSQGFSVQKNSNIDSFTIGITLTHPHFVHLTTIKVAFDLVLEQLMTIPGT